MEMRKTRQIGQVPLSYFAYIFKFGLLSLLIFFIIFFTTHLPWGQYFPIKTVRIYGIQKLNEKDIENALTPLVKRGFFTVKVEAIRERLLQLPWVADILVKRAWPDKIEVRIIEKVALAYWNDKSLLSSTGDLFSPAKETYPENLPHFKGPDGQQMVMLHYYNAMNQILTPLNKKITYLELSPYHAFNLSLDNGLQLHLGYKDILTRLNQFVTVYEKIIGNHPKDVEYVDLRYPNGIAIRWRTGVKT